MLPVLLAGAAPIVSVCVALAFDSFLPILIIHIPIIIWLIHNEKDTPKPVYRYPGRVEIKNDENKEAFERYQHYRIATGKTRNK